MHDRRRSPAPSSRVPAPPAVRPVPIIRTSTEDVVRMLQAARLPLPCFDMLSQAAAELEPAIHLWSCRRQRTASAAPPSEVREWAGLIGRRAYRLGEALRTGAGEEALGSVARALRSALGLSEAAVLDDWSQSDAAVHLMDATQQAPDRAVAVVLALARAGVCDLAGDSAAQEIAALRLAAGRLWDTMDGLMSLGRPTDRARTQFMETTKRVYTKLTGRVPKVSRRTGCEPGGPAIE